MNRQALIVALQDRFQKRIQIDPGIVQRLERPDGGTDHEGAEAGDEKGEHQAPCRRPCRADGGGRFVVGQVCETDGAHDWASCGSTTILPTMA